MRKIKLFFAKKIIENYGFLIPNSPDSFWFYWPLYYYNRRLNLWSKGFFQNNITNEELAAFQLRRLKKILIRARNIPHWSKVISDAGIDPTSVNSITEITKLPILSRTLIQEVGADLYDQSRLSRFHIQTRTSGSTGRPLEFNLDFKSHSIGKDSAFLYPYQCLGMGNNDAALVTVTPFSKNLSHNLTGHGVYIDYRSLNPRLIKSLYLAGVLGDVMNVAEQFEKDGIKPTTIKFVGVLGEQLYESTRDYLENIFGATVLSRYGTREFGTVAFECPYKRGFHINPDRFIVEIVNNEGKHVSEDETGRILFTLLDQEILPFVRYEIGDIGKWLDGECPCGLKTPRISFEGRKSHFLQLPNGKKFPVLTICTMLDHYSRMYIKGFQVIQEARNKIILNLIPTAFYNRRVELFLIQTLLNNFDCWIDIAVKEINEIPKLPNGKAQVFISKI